MNIYETSHHLIELGQAVSVDHHEYDASLGEVLIVAGVSLTASLFLLAGIGSALDKLRNGNRAETQPVSNGET